MNSKKFSMVLALAAYVLYGMVSFDVEKDILMWLVSSLSVGLIYYVAFLLLFNWLERVNLAKGDMMSTGSQVDFVLPEDVPEGFDQDVTKLDGIDDQTMAMDQFDTNIDNSTSLGSMSFSDTNLEMGELDRTENMETLAGVIPPKMDE